LPSDAEPITVESFECDLLQAVSNRTGYPISVLNLDMALEAELGIDSIKTIEIFSNLKRYHALLRVDNEDEEDMLERFTNKKLKSTIHRVVNPPREKMHTSRYSIPFFMHPRSEMDLSCLSSCISEAQPKQFTDITAGEFLEERLRELGLRK
jgi:hypothetical protein